MAKLQKRDYQRERLIMRLHDCGYTYKQIAGKLDITKVRVGQIYRRVLKEKNKVKIGAA